MQYSDTTEQSSEYLRLALDHMGRFNLPVDPANYSVWYEYVSGKNQQLKLVIDHALSKSKVITPELNMTLYDRYIANEHKIIIKKIREELRKVLETILSQMVDAGGQLTRFGTMIQIYSHRLKDELDADGVRNIVEDILSETEAIKRSGMLLKERIVSSTSEIENLRKDLDKVREEASTDMLTGLKNRRFLTEIFERESRHSIASGSNLSAIMIDIDHFKRINDTFGHIMGDRVLRTTASMIRDCVKGRDTVIRYGGEEFIVILPETPLEGALALAEQICSYFKHMNWKRKDTGEHIGHVYISLGVSLYRPGESLDAFIQRADNALYLSKSNGRCRVTSESSLQEEYKIAGI